MRRPNRAWVLMAFAVGYAAGWLPSVLPRPQLVAIMVVVALLASSAMTRSGPGRPCR